MKAADVIIIGGGLQGCSTALHLLRRGISVIVLEKATAGRYASGMNAGGVRRLNRAIPEIPLSLASLELWYQLESIVGNDCGFRPIGQVRIAETFQDMSALEDRVRQLESFGYSHEELIDQKHLRRIVPTVSDHCVGGLFCREDGAAEPFITTRAFYHKAGELGGEFYEYHPVTAIERTNNKWRIFGDGKTFESPVVVNCAGAWGDRIAVMIGDSVPLLPEALSMMVTARVSRFLEPVVGLIGRKLSFKQMSNGTVVIGGGHISKLDIETEKTVIDFSQLKISAQTVKDIFPLMKHVPIVRCWAGIEGSLPDQMPVIGPSQNAPDAYHAFGFSGHGFQLGPIIGQVMTELIIDGRSSLPIDAFRIERFSH